LPRPPPPQGVSLALSLHAPTQELRQQIVPSARAYKLDKLMAAVDDYMARSGQKVGLLRGEAAGETGGGS
jgi:adenine C2-methylase RlmN of 23S rRNA A2503 and tRNA A37